jgi:hypothetical protein
LFLPALTYLTSHGDHPTRKHPSPFLHLFEHRSHHLAASTGLAPSLRLSY